MYELIFGLARTNCGYQLCMVVDVRPGKTEYMGADGAICTNAVGMLCVKVATYGPAIICNW
jgi:hypothetical protein